MPVEAQARRQRTPLRRRDRVFLAVIAMLAAAGVVVGIVVHFPHTGTPQKSCITFTLPSTMGGATIRKCGADAVRFCRQTRSQNDDAAAACRRKGL